MNIPKIEPKHRVPGYRILRRGDIIRATDLQYTDSGFIDIPKNRAETLTSINITAAGTYFVGVKWSDSMYYGNLYYRKLSK